MGKFECTFDGCKKSFNRRDYLERHAANHLPVKPFVCEPCSRSFARSDLYENHLITKFHLKRAVNITTNANANPIGKVNDDGNINVSNKTKKPNDVLQCINNNFRYSLSESTDSPFTSPITSPDSGTDYEEKSASNKTIPGPHSWLFDDGQQDWSSRHYDRLYTQLCHYCEFNACQDNLSLKQQNYNSRKPIPRSIMISDDLATKVSSILTSDPNALSSLTISNYMDLCWNLIEAIHQVVHRPTFIADNAPPQLLAVLSIIGMYYAYDNNDYQFSTGYTQLLSSVKYALFNQPQSKKVDVGLLQAFSILFWFECQLRRDNQLPSFIPTSGCLSDSRQVLKLYKCILSIQPNLQYFTHCSPSAMCFAFVSDDEDAWLEWITYESCKRAVHFLVYCATNLNTISDCQEFLNVFDIDTHMPFPEVLWRAQTSQDFFSIVGPTKALQIVPFLYVLKSIMRLPKLGEPDKCLEDRGECYWSMYALSLVLYGLLQTSKTIASGVSAQKMVDAVYERLKNKTANFNNRQISIVSTSRLARGFKIWRQYFETSSINVEYSSSLEDYELKYILNQLPVNHNNDIFFDNIIVMLLHYRICRILMQEDLYLIQRLSIDLPLWLDHRKPVLIDNQDEEIYSRWVRTREAQSVVSLSAMYLLQLQYMIEKQDTESTKTILTKLNILSITSYYAVLVIWIYDRYNNSHYHDNHNSITDNNYLLIKQDAISYLTYLYDFTKQQDSNTNCDISSTSASSTGSIINNNVYGFANSNASSVVCLGANILQGIEFSTQLNGGDILTKFYSILTNSCT